jgi:cytosine/adenosine deaminase-related metal-dependent hydrolase
MKIYAASYLVPVSGPPVEGGALLVEDGRIRAAGKLSDIRTSHPATVLEFPGCVILPGFVNAHTHLELTHFSSWKIRKDIDYSPRTYIDWVIQVIKITRGLTRDEREHSLREGIRISLESGTTAIGEIVSGDAQIHLYGESTLCGRLYLEAIGRDPMHCASLLARLEADLETFGGSKILPGLSPHAPHTLSEAFMKDIAAMAAKRSLPMAIHLAESREEVDFLFDSTGKIADLLYPFAGWESSIPSPQKMSPTEYLENLGILEMSPTLIHCVHVNHADAELLIKRGCRVVLCPRSNDRLNVGKAPAYLFKKMGIPMALGTDSLASNDSLSMLDEMRYMLTDSPDVFTPGELLRMATLGAAEAVGLDKETGSLEEGKRADFLVMGFNGNSGAKDLPRAIIEEGKLMEVITGGEFLGIPGRS